MKKKQLPEKMYRTFSVGETHYSGRDGNKARGVDYIFDAFGDSLNIADSSVLDLGCAGGGVAFRALALGAKLVVGVERDDKKLNQAKLIASSNRLENISFHSESLSHFLCRSDRKFDYVFLLNIIHHLPEPQWVLERVAEVATKGVIVEGPLRRLFVPYAPDRGRPRSHLVPWGPGQETKFFGELDYELKSSVPSPNAVSFIGGERSLRMYERKMPVDFNSGLPADLRGRILIGPGTSGKTFTVQKIMGMSVEETCAPYKLRNPELLRKVVDAIKGVQKVPPAAQGSVFYIPPTEGKRIWWAPRLRGHHWNSLAWIQLARKSNLPIVVCHASRKARSERLLFRMQNRYLSESRLQGLVQEVLDIARDRDISDKEARSRIRGIVPTSKATFVLNILRNLYLPNLDFSYERLYGYLRSVGVTFEILETSCSSGEEGPSCSR